MLMVSALTVASQVADTSSPALFSIPFSVSSRAGGLWITPDDNLEQHTLLMLKGANWMGFQADGCPHVQGSGVQATIDFLVNHRFNSVRLPLSTAWVNGNWLAGQSCGEYSGLPTLSVLDDLLSRLRVAGIFVFLDMHTATFPETNTGLWCGRTDGCTQEDESSLVAAWQTLADRSCTSHPNVIGADVYNEVKGA